MNPKQLFQDAATMARKQAEAAGPVIHTVHHVPIGQTPGQYRTTCGMYSRDARTSTSRESSVTCLDCLDAMAHQVRTMLPVRVIRFPIHPLVNCVAKVELTGHGFRVLELTMISPDGPCELTEVVKIINGITAALRDIGELGTAPQSSMPEDPEPFDEATGPADDRDERRREYEGEIGGCRNDH